MMGEKTIQSRNKIFSYNNVIIGTHCPYVREYYRVLMCNEINKLNSYIKMDNEAYRMEKNQKQFTIEELSTFNGAAGKPAYVAVGETVYDVSLQATWGGGTHFGLYAGKDLTKEFMGCHQNKLEILSGLPVVGQLKK